MSTKIYNAYICKLGMPYLNLIIEELRHEYYEELKKIILPIPYQLKRKCIEYYEDDSIVIYPLKNGDVLFQEWRYKLGYDVNLPTIDLMMTFNKIKDYHYQNQSDPWYVYEEPPLSLYDLAIAEFEYEQREKDWDEVFGDGSWTPAESGFTIPYINNKIKLEWEK